MLKYTKNSGDYCFALCDGYDECFVHWTTHHKLLHTFMCQDHMYDVRPPAPLCDAHGQSAGADLASSALTCCAASCLRAACHICCSSCKSCPVTTTGSNTWETCLTQWCLLGTAKSAPQACFACMHVQQRRRNIQQAVSLQESIMSDKSHKTAMNSLDMSSYAY